MTEHTVGRSIDLAPNHKLGLVVANPILLGAGSIGYGEAVPRWAGAGGDGRGGRLRPNPGREPRRPEPPRLAHTTAGLCLRNSGLQNRGVSNAVQQYGKLWGKLGCPVVVQVAESRPTTLGKVLQKLGRVSGVHATAAAA